MKETHQKEMGTPTTSSSNVGWVIVRPKPVTPQEKNLERQARARKARYAEKARLRSLAYRSPQQLRKIAEAKKTARRARRAAR